MKHLVAVCGVCLAVCAGGCSRSRAESPSRGVPVVAVVEATRGDITQSLTVAAEFRPYQEVDVHAKVAGYLKSIAVDVGDRVRSGQLLAVLEIPELRIDLQQEEASVKRANEEINRAQADLERAESAHDVAHLGSARLASVSKTRPNLIAQQDLDEATGRDRVAEAQVSTAKAALASAREQLEVTRANLARTSTLLAYTQITAPFDGVVTHRYADTGAMIQAGTSSQTQTMPLVRLSENSVLRLVIPVPESAAARVHERAHVDVRVDALDRTFPGTVARLAGRLDPDTRTLHAEVDVPNPKLELLPGMFAQVSIAVDEARDAVTVPVQAVDRGEEHTRVLVVGRDHALEPREVRVGLESAQRVAIREGLQAGELVVVGSRSQLKPGAIVSPKVVAAATGSER